MDNGIGLAPTPIVRITAEQLEYLISRVANKGYGVKRGWKARTITVPVPAGSTVPVLNVDKTRKLLHFGSVSQGLFFYPGDANTIDQGMFVVAGQPFPLFLSIEDWGWSLTQTWYCRNPNAGAGIATLTEVFGPPSINEG